MSHRRFPDVVYHLTSPDGLSRIMESGGIKPQLNPLGSYVLDPGTLSSHWLRRTRFFGSPLQALILGIYGRGHTEIVVLKVALSEGECEAFIYDLRSVFDSANPGPYLKRHRYHDFSFSPNTIPEMIVRQTGDEAIPCDRIKVMHTVPISCFGGMKRLSRERLDPVDLLSRLLGQERTPLPIGGGQRLLFVGLQFRLLLLRGLIGRLFTTLAEMRARPVEGDRL